MAKIEYLLTALDDKGNILARKIHIGQQNGTQRGIQRAFDNARKKSVLLLDSVPNAKRCEMERIFKTDNNQYTDSYGTIIEGFTWK